MENIIDSGAEAKIILNKNIIKRRIIKKYRLPILDNKIRKIRTRKESKILEKIKGIIPAPILIKTDEKENIEMTYINGKKLSLYFEKMKNKEQIAEQIGNNLSKLHNLGIVHGDLTTSNMIYNEKEKKVYFIDFGLGYESKKIEDKAVDLHLIKEALKAKHYSIWENIFQKLLKGYKESFEYMKIINRMKEVESRGRYKKQY